MECLVACHSHNADNSLASTPEESLILGSGVVVSFVVESLDSAEQARQRLRSPLEGMTSLNVEHG